KIFTNFSFFFPFWAKQEEKLSFLAEPASPSLQSAEPDRFPPVPIRFCRPGPAGSADHAHVISSPQICHFCFEMCQPFHYFILCLWRSQLLYLNPALIVKSSHLQVFALSNCTTPFPQKISPSLVISASPFTIFTPKLKLGHLGIFTPFFL